MVATCGANESANFHGTMTVVAICPTDSVCNSVRFVVERRIDEHWPELISRDFDSVQVINMYKRFAAEAMQVWQGYPEVRALL